MGPTWVNHWSCWPYMGQPIIQMGHNMGQPWVTCGSTVGQPWIMWVTYGVMYWSTMGRIGYTKRTLVIETPGYSGPLPFRNEGP
jgi:hypothetical protein